MYEPSDFLSNKEMVIQTFKELTLIARASF